MTAAHTIPVTWAPREPPLAPGAAAALGATATALGRRLLGLESLAALRGCAGPDGLVVIGPEAALPWVDGVVYLGRDPLAPGLWLPTALTPSVPVALLALALGRKAPGGLAVLPSGPALLSTDRALPLDRGALARWLEGR